MKIFIVALTMFFANLSPLYEENSNAIVPIAPTVYSGNCTLYRLSYTKSNKLLYTPVKTAFGKIVIDKRTRKFSFYFGGKLVGSWTDFNSYIDDNQGGEGYTMEAEWSAHRFTAERTFHVSNITPNSATVGSEYVITNYKIN